MLLKILFITVLSFLPTLALASDECVILLHGLGRLSNSMSELERKLGRAGYDVANIKYPSRRYAIEVLAPEAVERGVTACREYSPNKINFVTHSLGGILIRFYLQEHTIPELGRVVMLGPPNRGSLMVDGLTPVPGFSFLTGPTGIALGAGGNSIVAGLGEVEFELGVIAGDTNVNPLSRLWIPSPNDSIVAVESTKVEGMNDHKVLPVTHTFMMRNNEVIDEAIHFLKNGNFIPEDTDSR